MRVLSCYLVVRSDGSARAVTRKPHHLRFDEIAVPVRINIPDGWAKINEEDQITVNFPNPPKIEQKGKVQRVG